jgi:hypothetical protein
MKDISSLTGTAVITSSTRMCFLEADGPGAAIDADLQYDAKDPYAVTVIFRTATQSVQWTFGRELLAQGVHEPAGVGDVQVWPCLSDEGAAVVVIELSSPDGDVMVQASSRDVALFVNQMLATVPVGSEAMAIDFDAELAGLV